MLDFFCGLLRLHDHGHASRSYYSSLLVPMPGVAADCWTRQPGRQARSRGGASAVSVGEAAGHAQLTVPTPLLVARRLTACPTICAPSLTSLLRARSRTSPKEPPFQRPPTSAPSTTRRCGPPATRSGYVARLRRSRSAAPSTSALHGCGCACQWRHKSGIAAQGLACGCGSIHKHV